MAWKWPGLRLGFAHGGGSPFGMTVISFNGRTGVVASVAGDYSSTLIGNLSLVTGLTVTQALDALLTLVNANAASIALKADKTLSLAAGAGLTGGGDLSANRTFDVVAADATIQVNADSIQVGTVPSGQIANASGQGGTQAQAQAATVTDALNEMRLWGNEYAQCGGVRAQANTAVREDGLITTALQGAVARVPAAGSYLSKRVRNGFDTTAVAGNIAYLRTGAAVIVDESRFVFRHGVAAVSANMRWFSGLQNTATPVNADPASMLSVIGIAGYPASANVQLLCNDAAGAPTVIDLGVNFPSRTAGAAYEAMFIVAPGAATIYYRIRRLDLNPATNVVVGSFASNLPSAAFPQLWVCNNTDASIVGVDFLDLEVAVPA